MEKQHAIVSTGDLIDLQQIVANGKKKATIMYKINTLTFVLGIVFIAILISWNNITRIIGAIFIIVACIAYFKTPNQKVMEIYDDSIVIYDTDVQGKVLQIMLQDLDAFSCGMYDEGFNLVVIRTVQGDVIYCETYESSKADRALRKIAEDKELRKKQQDDLTKNLVSNMKKKKNK